MGDQRLCNIFFLFPLRQGRLLVLGLDMEFSNVCHFDCTTVAGSTCRKDGT